MDNQKLKVGDVFYTSFVDSHVSNVIVKYKIKDIHIKNLDTTYICDVYKYGYGVQTAELDWTWMGAFHKYPSFTAAISGIINEVTTYYDDKIGELQKSATDRRTFLASIKEF